MQMKFRSAFGTTVVALALAVAPVAGGALGFANMAYAKGGNGNGGGNGGGNGNGGSHGSSNSSHGTSSSAQSDDSDDTDGSLGSLKHTTHSSKSAAANRKLEKTSSTKVKTAAAELGSLNSLKRNYHAYMNSKDPKMAAIRAYVMDYAEFELKHGTNAVPTDPALSDEALRSALAQASKTGVVTDRTLAEAKSILGVGPAVGKIDQVRDALEQSTATTTSAN
jgi:hypothetical protein